MTAHFDQSGGIFTGAEVTYRGVGIGQVSEMKLTDKGVDVLLSIEKDSDKIPADSVALVGNKSAVGEQYVELQPQTDDGPYLKDGSEIDTPDTQIPVSTTEILTNLDNLVQSVPQADLRTVVAESGAAFKDAGPSLGQIIDTSSSFIETAEANFDTTTALIRDTRMVLQTQVDKGSAIRSFTRDLALFTRHPGRQRQVPPLADRQRLGHRQRAADLPRAEPGQPRPADQQPGHHQRGRRQAPQGHPPDPGHLPLRGRRRIHRGEEERRTAATTPSSG